MNVDLAELKQQLLHGRHDIGSVQELVLRRIEPEDIDMNVFASWKKQQKKVMRFLRRHITQFSSRERMAIYIAIREFDARHYVSFLAKRFHEEDDPDCRELLNTMLMPSESNQHT